MIINPTRFTFVRYCLFCLFVFLFASCAAPEEGVEEAPAMPEQAVLVGADSVSSALPEFATTFMPDGNTMLFNRTSTNRDTIKIFSSTLVDGAWSKAEPLWFSDGTYLDVDPFVNYDGTRLYFNSDRPLIGEEPMEEFDTWYSEYNDGEWGAPINMGPPLNGPLTEVFVSLTTENTIYLSMSIDGLRAIYRSELTDEGYEPLEKINMPIPDTVAVGNPLIDLQERFLLFTTRQLDGYGDSDIYIADHVADGLFDNVRNAGPLVNSTYTEFAPGISPDGQYLYFASERPGVVGPMEEGVRPPGDLYRVSLEAVVGE